MPASQRPSMADRRSRHRHILATAAYLRLLIDAPAAVAKRRPPWRRTKNALPLNGFFSPSEKHKNTLSGKDIFRRKPAYLLITCGLTVSRLWNCFLAWRLQILVIHKVLALINKIISYARGYPQERMKQKKVGSPKPEAEKSQPEKPTRQRISIIKKIL